MFAGGHLWLRALVAVVELVLALDVLTQLDRDLGAILVDVRAVLANSEASALRDLDARVAQVEATRVRMRDHVLATLSAGDLESREANVRTRIIVVLAQLSTLADAATELPRGISPFGGRFETVAALQAYVVSRVEEVVRTLRRECSDALQIRSRPRRLALQRLAVGKAECSLIAIGRDPELVFALGKGAEVVAVRFGTCCRMLMLAFGGAVTPDLARLARASRQDLIGFDRERAR